MNRSTRRGVDEADVVLLDALHANPRVSFERLGPVLGISPVTAARRWQKLSESGAAWVSSVPGPQLALLATAYGVCKAFATPMVSGDGAAWPGNMALCFRNSSFQLAYASKGQMKKSSGPCRIRRGPFVI